MSKIEIERGGESKAGEALWGAIGGEWWQEGRRLLADCCWAGLETMSEKLQDGRPGLITRVLIGCHGEDGRNRRFLSLRVM